MIIKVSPSKQVEEAVIRAIHKTFGQQSFIYSGCNDTWYSAGDVFSTNNLYANLCNSLDYQYRNTNLGRIVSKPLGVKVRSLSVLGHHLPIKCLFDRTGTIRIENACLDGFDEHTSVYHAFVRNIVLVLQQMQIKYHISENSH